MSGLIASVYSSSFYRADRGISSYAKDVVVVNIPGPFEPTSSAPAVLLLPGNGPGYVRAVPAEQDDSGTWRPVREGVGPMAGGSYIGTSDSRWSEALRKMGATPGVAVPLHDRFETVREYTDYSKD